MTPRDRQRLVGVYPPLVAKWEQLDAYMASIGHPIFVAQAVRTAPEQYQLYRQGREIPGPNVRPGHPLGDTVTNCDGTIKKSNHQASADGYGHALDAAFVGPKPFHKSHPWAKYGAKAMELGLVWGGSWKTRIDMPHVELAA